MVGVNKDPWDAEYNAPITQWASNTRYIRADLVDPAAIREAALQARIEELVKERDTAREYAGEVRIREKVAEDARIEAEAKLAKAVEALRNTLDKPRDADQSYAGLCSEVMWEIRATLAELEGK